MVMSMKQFRIKDNTQARKESFSEIPNLTTKIADKTLEQLEREGIFVFPEVIDDAEDITRDHSYFRVSMIPTGLEMLWGSWAMVMNDL